MPAATTGVSQCLTMISQFFPSSRNNNLFFLWPLKFRLRICLYFYFLVKTFNRWMFLLHKKVLPYFMHEQKYSFFPTSTTQQMYGSTYGYRMGYGRSRSYQHICRDSGCFCYSGSFGSYNGSIRWRNEIYDPSRILMGKRFSRHPLKIIEQSFDSIENISHVTRDIPHVA